LLDQFPNPYTDKDADFWLGYCQHLPQKWKSLAIVVFDEDEGRKVAAGSCRCRISPLNAPIPDHIHPDIKGGIGVYPLSEPNQDHVAKVGYWLGEKFWGRGIVPEALSLMLELASTEDWRIMCNFGRPIVRFEAELFEWNAKSARVLEKNGFTFEARLRKSYFKDGKYVDGLLYSKIVDV
jgi:RimJ/RimL family protein N-acetyltransferase